MVTQEYLSLFFYLTVINNVLIDAFARIQLVIQICTGFCRYIEFFNVWNKYYMQHHLTRVYSLRMGDASEVILSFES